MRIIMTFVAAVAVTFAAGAQAADAGKAEALAKASGCFACHTVDKKLVGPAYKEVAAKYRNDKQAAAKLAAKVKKGSQGVWGNVPMPPNTAVPDADVNALVKWILSQK